MKKCLVFLLAVMMVILLAACGEVGKVEDLIDAIGVVSIDSNDAINAAQDAYNALDAEQQAKVENFQTLKDAHEQYALAVNEKNYSDAVAAFEAEDYTKAKELFTVLGNFKDSAARAEQTEKAICYVEAVSLLDAAKYAEAADMFQKALGFADAEEKMFEAGVGLLDTADYAKAIEVMELCSDASKDAYIAYANGAISMADGKYEEAQTYFEAAGDVNDAAAMVNNCIYMQAEANMEKGYLNTAKSLYDALPDDFSYNGGKTVGDRLAQLEQFNSFVELCGIWQSSDMDSSVRQTHDSTGLWDQWDGNGWGYNVEVTCVLNDDNTATLKAKANFWHYNNYSSLSSNLKYGDDSCTFTYTGTSVPSKMDFSLDFTYEYRGTLTIKGKTFKLDYKIVDANSSMNFTYTYKSFGTYDKLIKTL